MQWVGAGRGQTRNASRKPPGRSRQGFGRVVPAPTAVVEKMARRSAAGERAVDRLDAPLDAHARVRAVHDEHRRAAIAGELVVGARHADHERGPVRARDEALAPVDAPAAGHAPSLGAERRRVGAGPRRRLAHREGRAHAAVRERAQQALLLLVAADDLEQVHVALVGRRAVQRRRAEQAVAGLLEHRGLRPCVSRSRHRRERQRSGSGRPACRALAALQLVPQRSEPHGPCRSSGACVSAGRTAEVAHERAVTQLVRLWRQPRVGRARGCHPLTAMPVKV